MATENWSPKKGEKIRASMKPLRNGNKGVIVEFCYHTLHGTVVDTEDEEWEYYDRYEEPAAQTWKDVVASTEYIPKEEQQQIKEKLMPELEKKWEPKENEIIWVSADNFNWHTRVFLRFTGYQYVCFHSDTVKVESWQYAKRDKGELYKSELSDQLHSHVCWDSSSRKFKPVSEPISGEEYIFWNGSEEPVFEGVFIAKCNGIYLATLRKFYSYLHEGKALTIVPYKNFRKIKEPIKITVDQILEKFNISKDDKVVLEGDNRNVSVNLTPHFDNGISPTVLGYLSGMNPGATRPHNFSLGDDGFTDKTDIFDNKGMD